MPQVEAFYIHFQQNYKDYEKLDDKVVAELFILTDFQKFKDEMLANKKAMGEGVVKEEA